MRALPQRTGGLGGQSVIPGHYAKDTANMECFVGSIKVRTLLSPTRMRDAPLVHLHLQYERGSLVLSVLIIAKTIRISTIA
jgi:hypothetical protein